MIQSHYFPDLSFVLHDVRHPSFKGRASAWFDSHGRLTDAELITSTGIRSHPRVSPVPASMSNVRATLTRIGRTYIHPDVWATLPHKA